MPSIPATPRFLSLLTIVIQLAAGAAFGADGTGSTIPPDAGKKTPPAAGSAAPVPTSEVYVASASCAADPNAACKIDDTLTLRLATRSSGSMATVWSGTTASLTIPAAAVPPGSTQTPCVAELTPHITSPQQPATDAVEATLWLSDLQTTSPCFLTSLLSQNATTVAASRGS